MNILNLHSSPLVFTSIKTLRGSERPRLSQVLLTAVAFFMPSFYNECLYFY